MATQADYDDLSRRVTAAVNRGVVPNAAAIPLLRQAESSEQAAIAQAAASSGWFTTVPGTTGRANRLSAIQGAIAKAQSQDQAAPFDGPTLISLTTGAMSDAVQVAEAASALDQMDTAAWDQAISDLENPVALAKDIVDLPSNVEDAVKNAPNLLQGTPAGDAINKVSSLWDSIMATIKQYLHYFAIGAAMLIGGAVLIYAATR